MNNDTKTLIVFVATVALNVFALMLDLALVKLGYGSISARVWACPMLGLPLVAVQCVGLIALVLHLWR